MLRAKFCLPFLFTTCAIVVSAQQAALPQAPSASASQVSSAATVHPSAGEAELTTRDKFNVMLKDSFNPFEFILVAAEAGVSQARDQFPQYGQGGEGYGKRFGAGLADEVSSSFFSDFVYSSLLKEDPRYYRLGHGSFTNRVGHAIKEEFVCRTNGGGRSFSYQNVLGAFTAGGISNIYYPSNDRGFALTMSRSALNLVYGTAGGMFLEFWPDVSHKVFGRKSKERP